LDVDKIMKIALALFVVLLSTAAIAQTAPVLSGQAQMVQIPDHPQLAVQHAMASEHSLFSSGDTYTYAQGERPLWEFPSDVKPTPLGDIARAYRKEKSAAKKAQKVFEKQGS
jgi:hypothetical protein